MTLNGLIAFILRYFTEFGSFRSALRRSGWRYAYFNFLRYECSPKACSF